jgi:putative endonuclease
LFHGFQPAFGCGILPGMGLLLSLERRIYGGLQGVVDRRAADRGQPQHLLTGERGEQVAYFHLRALGYTVVARRWRSERLTSDLDLVAWDGDTLVFFEVKTRTARDRAAAESQVHPHKQRLLRQMAAAYLRQLPERHRSSVPTRFDVLAVYLLPGTHVSAATTEFQHFPNAFPRQVPARRRW